MTTKKKRREEEEDPNDCLDPYYSENCFPKTTRAVWNLESEKPLSKLSSRQTNVLSYDIKRHDHCLYVT